MQFINRMFFTRRLPAFLYSGLMMTGAFAGTPLWTFTPLTSTTVAVPANGSALVQYRVTNQSAKPHSLNLQPIRGVSQVVTGADVCANPVVLRGRGSCVLTLKINGRQINTPITDGPVLCQDGNSNLCYRPARANVLQITQAPPVVTALIAQSGSPLTLTANGVAGVLTIQNTSTDETATGVSAWFDGTALDGKVTETGNTCASVPPGGNCTLTYTPGNTVVPLTEFIIQGTNTNAVKAVIGIEAASTLTAITPQSGPASGGSGFILSGSGLSGATEVRFDGVPATSINVVDSNTITGVTPAHPDGVVDVVVQTPVGAVTLANGFTYLATEVGQASSGGTIACLEGGFNNLVAATVDNSPGIEWGGILTAVGPSAQSPEDGASNTAAIVAALGEGAYAAKVCSDYEVDSLGHSPCQPGNTCYNDWFLPAGFLSPPVSQIECLLNNREAIGGFFDANYWSSTEFFLNPEQGAWIAGFNPLFTGILPDFKNYAYRVRCVRAFNP